jgi:hypothetical protein
MREIMPHAHSADSSKLARPMKVEEDRSSFRIPVLETAVANKYGASLTADRDAGERAQDVVDFCWMVKHSEDESRDPIDLDRLAALGELVWPGGGGEEIVRLVAEANAGKVPSLTE